MSGKTKFCIFIFLVVVYILGQVGVLDSSSGNSIPSKSAYEYQKNQKKREWTSSYEKNHSISSSSSGKKNTTKSYTSSTVTKSTSKKSTSSKSSMPDCDNYDNYDDFMDDWDGNMPDGSDAEDYWENW